MTDPVDRGRNRSETFAEFALRPLPATSRRGFVAVPIKKKLRLNVSLHTLLQILSLTLFEKLPLKQAVAGVEPIETNPAFYRQLNLFEF